MKGGVILLPLLLPLVAAFAEEILSVRPVLIAPRRLDGEASAAETVISKRESDTLPQAESRLVVARLAFRKNSMRLTPQTRRQLKALAEKKNTPLRVTGFADDDSARHERVANLRARAIASYLEEYAGITNIEIRWLKTRHPGYPGIGAIVEEKE